jgi:hypothetical protein
LLSFSAHQVWLESLGRFYLPLPKMTSVQLKLLEGRLTQVGLNAKASGGRLNARGFRGALTVLSSGLAWSSGDMLDLLAPALPRLLGLPREPVEANPYFAAKRTSRGHEIQFFPRMEGLRIWSALRASGVSGLTPDEKAVIGRLLSGSSQMIECVTDYPTEGGSLFQVGRAQYFRSSVSSGEFVSNLRTISDRAPRSTYLPRSSTLRVTSRVLPPPLEDERLGEWCFLSYTPKSL